MIVQENLVFLTYKKIRGLQKGAKLSEFQPLKYKPN